MNEEIGMPLKKKNGENLKCECGGIYRWNGTLLLSYPPQYNFDCEDCGDRIRMGAEHLFPERYPEFKKNNYGTLDSKGLFSNSRRYGTFY